MSGGTGENAAPSGGRPGKAARFSALARGAASAALALAVLMAAQWAALSARAHNGEKVGAGPAESSQPVEAGALRAARAADRLIVVIGREKPGEACVLAYEKSGGKWVEKYKVRGFVGRNGITDKKREGDGCTPAGVYGFGLAFGLAPNPGALKNYVRLTEQDFWVDDPKSRYYNTWVHGAAPDKDWSSAEDMYKETVAYRYAAIINYNVNPIVKGAGSAIFMHCSKGGPTAGCVAVPEADMVNFLRFINNNTRIVIARSRADLAKY